MEKKLYVQPEITVKECELENALLTGTREEDTGDGDGDTFDAKPSIWNYIDEEE